MTISTITESELPVKIAAERRELARVLSDLPASAWDAQTLCAGWRVREVVAHMTMPFRYSAARFAAELARSGGRFNAMSDRIARRDAAAVSAADLVSVMQDNATNPWKPPGGGSPCHSESAGASLRTGCGQSWTPSRRRRRASTSAPT